jgi:hypothetical protein
MENRFAEQILEALGLEQSAPSLGVQLTLGHGQMNAEAELELAPGVSRPTRPRWWDTPYGRWRLDVEAQAMYERFPDFEPLLLGENDLAWAGWLRSALHGGGRYLVLVAYHPGFPDLPPKVTIVEPQLPGETPHLLVPQQPCLYYRGHRERGYDPASTTAATLVAWTALWIHAYETWEETGTWPGREL